MPARPSSACFGKYLKEGANNEPWDDLFGDVGQAVGASALTQEVFRDTTYQMIFMRHDQDDSLHFRFQMPHSWDPETSVAMHVHLVPMADPVSDQVVRFAGQYVWVHAAMEIPAAASWTTFTSLKTISPGDAHKEVFAGLFTAAPLANANESDVLLVQVTRTGTDPGDTYTTSKPSGTAQANLGVLYADLHIQKSKIGTELPFPEG